MKIFFFRFKFKYVLYFLFFKLCCFSVFRFETFPSSRFDYIDSLLRSSRYYKSLSSSKIAQQKFGFNFFSHQFSLFDREFTTVFDKNRFLDSSQFYNFINKDDNFTRSFIPRQFSKKIVRSLQNRNFRGSEEIELMKSASAATLSKIFSNSLTSSYPSMRYDNSNYHSDSFRSDFSFQTSSSLDDYFFAIFSRLPSIEFIPHFNILPTDSYDFVLPYFNSSTPWSFFSTYIDPRQQVNFFNLLLDQSFLHRFIYDCDQVLNFLDCPFDLSKLDLIVYSKLDFSSFEHFVTHASFIASSAVFQVRDYFFSELFFSISSFHSFNTEFYSEMFTYFGAGDFYPFESFITEFLSDNVFFWKYGAYFHDTLYSPGSKFPYEYNNIYTLYPFLDFSFNSFNNVSFFNFDFISSTFYEEFALNNFSVESLDEEIFIEKNLVLSNKKFNNKFFFDYSRPLIEFFNNSVSFQKLDFSFDTTVSKTVLDPFDYYIDNVFFFKNSYRLQNAQYDIFSINFESRFLDFEIFFSSANSSFFGSFIDLSAPIFFSYDLPSAKSKTYDFWFLEATMYDRWSIFSKLKPRLDFVPFSGSNLLNVSGRYSSYKLHFGLFDPFDSAASLFPSYDYHFIDLSIPDLSDYYDSPLCSELEVPAELFIDNEDLWAAVTDPFDDEDELDGQAADVIISSIYSNFDEIIPNTFFDQHLSLKNFSSRLIILDGYKALDFRTLLFDYDYLARFDSAFSDFSLPSSFFDEYETEWIQNVSPSDSSSAVIFYDFSIPQVTQRFNPKSYNTLDSESELFKRRQFYEQKYYKRGVPRTKRYTIRNGRVEFKRSDEIESDSKLSSPKSFVFKSKTSSNTSEFFFLKFAPSYREYIRNRYFPHFLSNPYAFEVITDWYFQSQFELDAEIGPITQTFDFFKSFRDLALDNIAYNESRVSDFRFPFYENYIYQRPPNSQQDIYTPIADTWIVQTDPSFSKFSLSDIVQLFYDPYTFSAEKLLSHIYSTSSLPYSAFEIWRIYPSLDIYPHFFDFEQELVFSEPFGFSTTAEPFLDFDPEPTDGDLIDDYYWNILYFLEDKDDAEFYSESRLTIRDLYDGDLYHDVSSVRIHISNNYPAWADLHDDFEQQGNPTGFRVVDDLTSVFDFTSFNFFSSPTFKADDTPNNALLYLKFIAKQELLFPISFNGSSPEELGTSFLETELDQDHLDSSFEFERNITETLEDDLLTTYSIPHGYSDFFEELVFMFSPSSNFISESDLTHKTSQNLSFDSFFVSQTTPSAFFFNSFFFKSFQDSESAYYKDLFSRASLYEPGFSSIPYFSDRWYPLIPALDSNTTSASAYIAKDLFFYRNQYSDKNNDFEYAEPSESFYFYDNFFSTSLKSYTSLRSPLDRLDQKRFSRSSFDAFFLTDSVNWVSANDHYDSTLDTRLYYFPQFASEYYAYQGYIKDFDLHSYELGADEAFQNALETQPVMAFDDYIDHDLFMRSDSYTLEEEYSDNFQLIFSDSQDASRISTAPTYDFHDVFDSSSSSPMWFYALHSYVNSSIYLNYQLDRFNTAEWHSYDDPFQSYLICLDFSDPRYRYIDPVFDAGVLHGIHHYFLTRTTSNYIWEQIYFSFEFFVFDFLFSNYLMSLNATIKSTFSAVTFDLFQDDFLASEKTLYSFHYFQFKLIFDEFLSRRSYYFSLITIRQNFFNEYWVNVFAFYYYYKIFFVEFFPQLIIFFKTQIFLPFDDFATYKYSSLYYEKEILSFFSNKTLNTIAVDFFDEHWSNSILWFYAYTSFKSKGFCTNLSYSQFVSVFLNNDLFFNFSSIRSSSDPRVWILVAPFTEVAESVNLFNRYGLESGLSALSSELASVSSFLKSSNFRRYSLLPTEMSEFKEYAYNWVFKRNEEINTIAQFLGFSFMFITTTKLHVSRSFYFSVFLFFFFSTIYMEYIKTFNYLYLFFVNVSSFYKTMSSNFSIFTSEISYVVISSPFLKKNVHFLNASDKFPVNIYSTSFSPSFQSLPFRTSLPFFKKATFLNFKYSTMSLPGNFYPNKLHYKTKPLLVFKPFSFYFKSSFLSSSLASKISYSSLHSSSYHFASQFSARRRSLLLSQILPTRFSIADYIKKTKIEYKTPQKFFSYKGYFKLQSRYNEFLGRSSKFKPRSVRSSLSSQPYDSRVAFNDYDSMPVSHISYLDWYEISEKAFETSNTYATFLKYSFFENSFSSAKLLQKFLQQKSFFAAKTSATTSITAGISPFLTTLSFISNSFFSKNHIQPTSSGKVAAQIFLFRGLRCKQFSDYRLRYYYWSYYVSILHTTSLPSFVYLKLYWNFFFFNSPFNLFEQQLSFINSRKYGYHHYLSIFKPEDSRYLFFTRMFLEQDPSYYPINNFVDGFSSAALPFSLPTPTSFSHKNSVPVHSPFSDSLNSLITSTSSLHTSLPQIFLDSFSIFGATRHYNTYRFRFVSFRYFMRKLFHRNFSNIYKLYFSSLEENKVSIRSEDLKDLLLTSTNIFTQRSFRFFRSRLNRYETRLRSKLHTRIKSDERVTMRIRRRMRKLHSKTSLNNYKQYRRFFNVFSRSIDSVDAFSTFSSTSVSYSVFIDFIISLFSSHFDYDDFSNYTVSHLRERLHSLPHERNLIVRRSNISKRFGRVSANLKFRSQSFTRKRLFRPFIYFSDYFTSLDNESNSNQLNSFNGLVYEPYLSDYKARDRLEFPMLLRSLNSFNFNRFFRRRQSHSIKSFFTITDYNFRPREMRYRRRLGLFRKRNGFVIWRYSQNKPFAKIYHAFRRTLVRRRRVYSKSTSFPVTKLRAYVFPDFYSRWLRRGIVRRNLRHPYFTDGFDSTSSNFFRDLSVTESSFHYPNNYLNFKLNYFQDHTRSNLLSRISAPICYNKPFYKKVRFKNLSSYYNFAYSSFDHSRLNELIISFFRSRPFTLGKSSSERARLERLSAYRFHTAELTDTASFNGSTSRYPWFSKYPFTPFKHKKLEKIVLVDEKQFDPQELLEKEKARLAELEEQLRSKTPEEQLQLIRETYTFLLDQYSKVFDSSNFEESQDQDVFICSDSKSSFSDSSQTSAFLSMNAFLSRVENSFGSLLPFNYISSRFNRSRLLKILSSRTKLRRRSTRRKRRVEARLGSIYIKNYSYIKMWPNIFYGFYRFSLFPFSSTTQFFNFSYKNFFLGFFVNKYEFYFNFFFFFYKVFYACFYLFFYVFYAVWFSILSIFDSFVVSISTFFAIRAHRRLVSELKIILSKSLPDQVFAMEVEKWLRHYNRSILFFYRPFIYSITISTNPFLVSFYRVFNQFVTNFDFFSFFRFIRFNVLFVFDLFYRTIYSKVLFSKVQLPSNHRLKTVFVTNWLLDKLYLHFIFRSHFYFYFPLVLIIVVSRIFLYFIRFFIFIIFSTIFLFVSFVPSSSSLYLVTISTFCFKIFLNFFIFCFRYAIIKLSLLIFFFFKFFILHDEIQTFGFFFRLYDKFIVLYYFFVKFFSYYRYINYNRFFLNSYFFWFFKFFQFIVLFVVRRLRLVILWELFPVFLSSCLFYSYYKFYTIITVLNFFEIFFRLDFFWSIFFVQLLFFIGFSFCFRWLYPIFRQTVFSVFLFLIFVHTYFIYFGFYELYLNRYNRNSYQNFSFLDTYSGWENKLSKLLANNLMFSQTGYISYRLSLHRDPSTFFNLFNSLKLQYSFSSGHYFFNKHRRTQRLNTYTSKLPFPNAVNFGVLTGHGRTPSTVTPSFTIPYVSLDSLLNSTNLYTNSSNYYWNFFNPAVGSVYETYYSYGSRFQRRGVRRFIANAGGGPQGSPIRYMPAIGKYYQQYGNEADDIEKDETYWENNIYDVGAQDSMNYIPGFLFRRFLLKNTFSSMYKGYATSFSPTVYNEQMPKIYLSPDFSFIDYDEFMDYDGELIPPAEILDHDWDAFERPGLHHSWNVFMFDITEIQRFILFRKAQVVSTFLSDKFLFFNFQLDFFRVYFISKFGNFKLIFFSSLVIIFSFVLFLVFQFWFWKSDFYKTFRRLLKVFSKSRTTTLKSGLWLYSFVLICFAVFTAILHFFEHANHSLLFSWVCLFLSPTFDLFSYIAEELYYINFEIPNGIYFDLIYVLNWWLSDTNVFANYCYYRSGLASAQFREPWVNTSSLKLFFSKERFFRSSSLFTSNRIFARAHYIAGYHNRFATFTTHMFSPAMNYFGYILPLHKDLESKHWYTSLRKGSVVRNRNLAMFDSPLYYIHRFYSSDHSTFFTRFFLGSDALPGFVILRRWIYPLWTKKYDWPFRYFPWDPDYDYRKFLDTRYPSHFYLSSNYYRTTPTLNIMNYYPSYLSAKLLPKQKDDKDKTKVDESEQEEVDAYQSFFNYYIILCYLFRTPQDRFSYPSLLERMSNLYSIIEFFFSPSTDFFEGLDLTPGFDYVYRPPLYTYGSRKVFFIENDFGKRVFRPNIFVLPHQVKPVSIWVLSDQMFPPAQTKWLVSNVCFSVQTLRFFRLPREAQFRLIISYKNLSPTQFYPILGYCGVKNPNAPHKAFIQNEILFNFYPLLTQYRVLFEFQYARIQYYTLVYKNITHLNNLVISSNEFASRRYKRLEYLSDWGWYKDMMEPLSPSDQSTFLTQSISKDPNVSPKSRMLLSSFSFRETRPGPDWYTTYEQQRRKPFELEKEVYAPFSPKSWRSRHSGFSSSSNFPNSHYTLLLANLSDDAFNAYKICLQENSTRSLSRLLTSKSEILTVRKLVRYYSRTLKDDLPTRHSSFFKSSTHETFRLNVDTYSTLDKRGYNYRYSDWEAEKKFYRHMHFYSLDFNHIDTGENFFTTAFNNQRFPVLPRYRPFHRWNQNTFYFSNYQVIYDSLKQYEFDFFTSVKKSQEIVVYRLDNELKIFSNLLRLLFKDRGQQEPWWEGPIRALDGSFANFFLFSRHQSVYHFEKFLNWSVYRYFYSNAHQHTVSTYMAYMPYCKPPGILIPPDVDTSHSSSLVFASTFININRSIDPRNPDFLFHNFDTSVRPLVRYLNRNIQAGFLFQTNMSFAKIFQNKFALIFDNKFHPSIFLSEAYNDYVSPMFHPSFLYSTLLNTEAKSFVHNILIRYPHVVFGFRKPSLSGRYRFFFPAFRPISYATTVFHTTDFDPTSIPRWALMRKYHLINKLFYDRPFTAIPYRVFDFSTYPGRRFHFAYFNTFISSPLYSFLQSQNFFFRISFIKSAFFDSLETKLRSRPLVFLASQRDFKPRRYRFSKLVSFSTHHERVFERKYYFSQFVPFRLFDPSAYIPYRIYQTSIRQKFFNEKMFIIRSNLEYNFLNAIKVTPSFFLHNPLFRPYLGFLFVKNYFGSSKLLLPNNIYFRGTRWPVELFRFSGVSFPRAINTIYIPSYDFFMVRAHRESQTEVIRTQGKSYNYYNYGNRGGIFSYPTEASKRTKRDFRFFKAFDRNNVVDPNKSKNT